MNQVEKYVYGKKNNFTLATIVRLETSKKSFELGVNHILPAILETSVGMISGLFPTAKRTTEED